MGAAQVSPGTRMLRLWQRLSPWPGGRWLFGRMLGLTVPYTGAISPCIRELRPGYARIEMRDRRRVRNHLNSIHAIALSNLGEATSGLAMLAGLPPGTRGIVIRISTEYFKKARGLLVAEAHCEAPQVGNEDIEHEIHADIRDAMGEVVARTMVLWRLGPVP